MNQLNTRTYNKYKFLPFCYLLESDLFQGDIILSPQQKKNLNDYRRQRNATSNGTTSSNGTGYDMTNFKKSSQIKMNIQMWPYGKVPYKISPRLGMISFFCFLKII